MEKQIDMIDLILERALNRPGLIDWGWIDSELSRKGATVQRPVLHKRVMSMLATRAKKRW